MSRNCLCDRTIQQIESAKLVGYIAATTITNTFYIICKAESRESAISAIQRILTGLQLCAVDRTIVINASDIGLKDFEDSIQFAYPQ